MKPIWAFAALLCGCFVVRAQDMADHTNAGLLCQTAGGNVIRQVKPHYPRTAQKHGVAGAVVIQVQVAPDGTVQSAEVLHGPDALRKASLTAIRQWRWMPTLLHGQAVPREAEVWFWYTLRQKGL